MNGQRGVTAPRRLAFALALVTLVVVCGTAGYVVVADARLLDALYMTVISVSTVGFGEVIPLGDGGRILTMAVVVLGAGSVTFAAVTAIEFLLEGHVRDILGRRRMDRELERQHDHTIVCGFGRVGRQVVDTLVAQRRPVVVVDRDPERVQLAADRGVLYLAGDGSQEDVLVRAGLSRAAALVACTADDGDNVLIALTGKGLNPALFVVVRVKTEENESKARRAGADRVIAPAAIGGRRIAALITRPVVVDFLDVVTHASQLDFVLEEIAVRDGSHLARCSLREAQVRERYGVTVLAIRQHDGVMNTHPGPDDRLEHGDTLVVIGERDDLDRLEGAAG
ncbi:MAG: potassium channel protein [Actinomycetota bacterium]|nr:potassium channel protein [Actinomycetota bacterium]